MGGGVLMRGVAKAAASVGYRTGHAPLAARAWEDYERDQLARWEEEVLLVTLHLSPPSLEEAEEAASDLKEALREDARKECAGVLPSSPTHHVDDQSFSLPSPSPSRHMVKALALLQESPDVQNVVASLVADHKIWDAVMKNEKVLKYCAANRICTECTQESVDESETSDVPSPVVDVDGSPPSSELGGLVDFMQSLKLKVREMVSNVLSDLFESFMRQRGPGSTSTSTAIVGTGTGTGINSEDTAAGASFVALTIATIILIILKRGDI